MQDQLSDGSGVKILPERPTHLGGPLNVCHVCAFPTGKFTNKETEEVKRVVLFNTADGKKICNYCVDKGYGIRRVKMSKLVKKAWKKARNRARIRKGVKT